MFLAVGEVSRSPHCFLQPSDTPSSVPWMLLCQDASLLGGAGLLSCGDVLVYYIKPYCGESAPDGKSLSPNHGQGGGNENHEPGIPLVCDAPGLLGSQSTSSEAVFCCFLPPCP